MSKAFDTAATCALVFSALVLAGVAAKREFGAGASSGGLSARGISPTFVKDWESLGAVGTWIGDSNAKVRLVEFSDYECPFCRHFDEKFLELRDSVGSAVALLVVDFPLSNHRFARPAALAAECAKRQGRWEQYHHALFAKPDSFGLKARVSYARDAGITDTTVFAACVSSHRTSGRIDSAISAGRRLNIAATPTVFINGWRYAITPYDSLVTIVNRQAQER